MFSLSIAVIQVTAIIVYFMSQNSIQVSIQGFIFMSLGTAWAPGLITLYFLYSSKDYINIYGRIHLLLGWIYKFRVERSDSFRMIRDTPVHERIDDFLSELEDLLDCRIKLTLANKQKILQDFYTNAVKNEQEIFQAIHDKTSESKQDFSKFVMDEKDKQALSEVLGDLYDLRAFNNDDSNIDLILIKLINLTKQMTGAEKIEFQYSTILVKIKKNMGKYMKYAISLIGPIASAVFDILNSFIF